VFILHELKPERKRQLQVWDEFLQIIHAAALHFLLKPKRDNVKSWSVFVSNINRPLSKHLFSPCSETSRHPHKEEYRLVEQPQGGLDGSPFSPLRELVCELSDPHTQPSGLRALAALPHKLHEHPFSSRHRPKALQWPHSRRKADYLVRIALYRRHTDRRVRGSWHERSGLSLYEVMRSEVQVHLR
jgi:hypothetical protein